MKFHLWIPLIRGRLHASASTTDLSQTSADLSKNLAFNPKRERFHNGSVLVVNISVVMASARKVGDPDSSSGPG